jgi:tetratricopeptide (TPR) repeat protein
MRQRLPFTPILLFATLVAIGIANQASAQVGRVNGIVKDEAGQPLKGATVTADNPNIGQSLTATTDDKGRFTMIGLRAGSWRFYAQAPGFSPDAGEMPVRMGAPNPPVQFTLKKTGNANFGPLGGVTSKDLQAELAAADALFKQSRWDEAIAAYQKVLEKAPPITAINLQIAAAYRNKKDYAAALTAYEAALKADSGNQKAAVGIATMNLERGDSKAAEDALTKAAQATGAGRDVFFNLGEVTLARNDADAAARWYQKAAAADPYWGKPLYRLGQLAVKKGDTAGASKLMDQVIAVDPSSAEATLAKTSLESLNK